MAVSVVSFSFSRAAHPEARGLSFLLSAGFLYHILSPTGLWNYWGPRGPLWPSVAFPTTSYQQHLWSPTHWLPVFTELYNSSTPTQSPTQSLEWHVWSSSSGNDCHAVQRSLSSGASVYECIMGFLPCPISSDNFRLRDFFRLLAIGMRHFLPVHHFGMACLAGSKVKIQQYESVLFLILLYIYLYIYIYIYLCIYVYISVSCFFSAVCWCTHAHESVQTFFWYVNSPLTWR